MREPLLTDDVEEIPADYDNPREAVLQYAAESLAEMEHLERLVESYQEQRLKQGEAAGLLEEGYEEDDHIAFTWRTTDDDGEEVSMVVDSYVVGDRLERVEEELGALRRDIVETVAALRDWSGEAEEEDGPVKAVAVAYGVVNHSLAGDADQSGSVATFRDENRDAYRILSRYASNRKSLNPDMDTLDRYVSRGGEFRRDDLFGVATNVTLKGVDALDAMSDASAEEGRAIARTATERLEEREDGEEIVQPFAWEVGEEQKAISGEVEEEQVRRIYQ